MAMLSPETDHVVRLAVDAYLSGRRRPQVEGEIFFFTRNNRYRLVDGVLFGVGLPGQEAEAGRALLGAEFVGWLHEDDVAGSHVKLGWRPGARAVLVDPRRRHHTIVTSNTHAPQNDAVEPRVLPPRKTEPPPVMAAGSMHHQVGSQEIQPPARVDVSIPRPP